MHTDDQSTSHSDNTRYTQPKHQKLSIQGCWWNRSRWSPSTNNAADRRESTNWLRSTAGNAQNMLVGPRPSLPKADIKLLVKKSDRSPLHTEEALGNDARGIVAELYKAIRVVEMHFKKINLNATHQPGTDMWKDDCFSAGSANSSKFCLTAMTQLYYHFISCGPGGGHLALNDHWSNRSKTSWATTAKPTVWIESHRGTPLPFNTNCISWVRVSVIRRFTFSSSRTSYSAQIKRHAGFRPKRCSLTHNTTTAFLPWNNVWRDPIFSGQTAKIKSLSKSLDRCSMQNRLESGQWLKDWS